MPKLYRTAKRKTKLKARKVKVLRDRQSQASRAAEAITDTLRLAGIFLTHSHDLMHKASGWMLREAGKRDKATLTAFLVKYKSAMPRTMLRYAIEHYPEEERKEFMKK